MKPRFDFQAVSRVTVDDWSHGSLIHNDYDPGTILLLGPWGTTGGFIKLTPRGQFMSLTHAQVYLEAPIAWPHSSVTLTIHDNRAVFDMHAVKNEGPAQAPR